MPGRLRAVLVDDEPLAVTRLSRLLGATGRVEVVGRAGDAAEALAALGRLDADVVFLDIHMPGMTGLELAARLSRGPSIVFTTAYDQHALQAFEANAVDYLLKPIERKRLERALDKIERLRDDPSRADTATILGRLAAALRTLVRERLGALGISDAKQVGRLVGDVMKTHKGQVEAADVKRVAEELLRG